LTDKGAFQGHQLPHPQRTHRCRGRQRHGRQCGAAGVPRLLRNQRPFPVRRSWSLTGYGRYASDRTFLRRYDISRDDRLRSTINLERIDQNSYFSLAGWAVQTLRSGDRQGLVPIALPAVEYRRRLVPPAMGACSNFRSTASR
jgi:LPS-assembly protein